MLERGVARARPVHSQGRVGDRDTLRLLWRTNIRARQPCVRSGASAIELLPDKYRELQLVITVSDSHSVNRGQCEASSEELRPM